MHFVEYTSFFSPSSPPRRWAALVEGLQAGKSTRIKRKTGNRKDNDESGENSNVPEAPPTWHTPRLWVPNVVRGCPVERSRFNIDDVLSCAPVLVWEIWEVFREEVRICMSVLGLWVYHFSDIDCLSSLGLIFRRERRETEKDGGEEKME